MSSAKRVGRFGTFAFALGFGLLIISGATAAVASAAPADAGHSATTSTSASTAGSPRAHASTTGRSPRPAAGVAAAKKNTATKRTVAQRVPSLPTPPQVEHAILAALDGTRRQLDTLRLTLEKSVRQHAEAIDDTFDTLRNDLIVLSQSSGFSLTSPELPTLPPPTSTNPVIYGNREKKVQYWAEQSGNTCALMSAAMLIGQLTGKMPSEKDMVAEAESTYSVTKQGGKIYLAAENNFVSTRDVLVLLEKHGINAVFTLYTRDQGDRALTNLEAALGQNKSVAVAIHSSTVWKFGPGETAPAAFIRSDHMVTVLAIDPTDNRVWINDTGLTKDKKGQDLALPLGVFMKAWQASEFTTVTAVLANTPQSQDVTQSDLALAA